MMYIKLPVLISRLFCLASCLCVVCNLSDKVKVKCTLVHALRLCTGRMGHRGSRGIALLFLDHGTSRGLGVSVKPRPLYPRERPSNRCTGGWVGPRAGLDRCGKSRPTGIRSPDRPARSELLYRLSYPAHNLRDRSYFAVGLLSCTSKVWGPSHRTWFISLSASVSRHSSYNLKAVIRIPIASEISTAVLAHRCKAVTHTYCMVQNPSWATNWFAASQEIPHISRNPKVHYHTHKRPPLVSILGQPNPVHIPTSHLLEIDPYISKNIESFSHPVRCTTLNKKLARH